MRIVVFGAGAIGTYYAARMAPGHEVTLIARRAEHAEAIRRHGVRITGGEQDTVPVDVAPSVEALPPRTLVLLTTKVYDNDAAARSLAPALAPDTILLCLQNGLDGERIVRDAVNGRCQVLRGITDVGVTLGAPGEVSVRGKGPTLIADGPDSAAIADLLAGAGLDGRVSQDLRRDVWRKLIVNCVINPLTAMTGMEVGWIADPRLEPIKQRIVAECLAVARADGVTFADDMVEMLDARYGPSRNLSSMHQDLSRGRRTEIDHLNGAVVDLGRRHGLACPVNAALAAIIKALEAPGTAGD